MICSETVVVNRSNREGEYSLLHCRRWSCELCRPLNTWNVVKAAARGHPTTFLTLTCNPARYASPDEAARAMKKGLVAFRKALAREKKIRRVPMLVVFERCRSGWPHLHLLLRLRWVDQRWISDTWKRLTGANIVHIRKVDPGRGAARYVAKYLGKDLAAFIGCKRWWRSHDYEVEQQEDRVKVRYGSRIEFTDVPFDTIRENLIRAGHQIVDEKPGWLHFRVPDQ